MTRTTWTGLTIASLFFTLSANAQRGQEREAIANGWKLDYEAAKKLARKSNRPMMVVFRCVP